MGTTTARANQANLLPQASDAPASWPRGFPLEAIKDNRTRELPLRAQAWPFRRVGVLQSLADHDPDVDGIYRLTQPQLPFSFPRLAFQPRSPAELHLDVPAAAATATAAYVTPTGTSSGFRSGGKSGGGKSGGGKKLRALQLRARGRAGAPERAAPAVGTHAGASSLGGLGHLGHLGDLAAAKARADERAVVDAKEAYLKQLYPDVPDTTVVTAGRRLQQANQGRPGPRRSPQRATRPVKVALPHGSRGGGGGGGGSGVTLPRGVMMPYNAQARLHAYDAMCTSSCNHMHLGL